MSESMSESNDFIVNNLQKIYDNIIEFNIIDINGIHFLFKCISIIKKSNNKSINQTIVNISTIILDRNKINILSSIWNTISLSNDNKIQILNDINGLLSIYRNLISFTVTQNTNSNIANNIITINEFYDILSINIPNRLYEIIFRNYDSFSLGFQISLLIDILTNNSNLFIDFISVDTSVHIIELLLYNNIIKSKSNIIIKICELMPKLLIIPLNEVDIPINTLIDILFLKQIYNVNLAYTIISTIQLHNHNNIIDILDILSVVWSSHTFIQQSNNEKKEFLTNIVLKSIQYISKIELFDNRDNVSILSVLSNGVSNYLDVNDKFIRIQGMRIARQLAQSIGQTITFEELDIYESSPSISITKNEPEKSISKSHDIIDSNADGTDSNSDSELGAYELDEPNNKIKKSVYLRQCLEMLQCPDSKPEAYEFHQQALNNIPIIVESNPYDARDICPLLIRQLIHTPNSFNMENFDLLHEKAMLSVMLHLPDLCLPIVLDQIQSSDFISLIGRLNIINNLIDIAYILANIPKPYTTGSNMKSNDKIDEANSVLDEYVHNSKTTIKRPQVLANSKKSIKYYKNRLLPYVHLLYQSMVKIFLLSIYKQIDSNMTYDRIDIQLVGNKIHLIDNIDMLLPTKALNAIAVFTKCSYNTIYQRDFIYQTLQLSMLFKDCTAITLRRAICESIYISMESYKYLQLNKQESFNQITSINQSEVLHDLMNISTSLESNNTLTTKDMTVVEDMLQAVDWATSTIRDDNDLICRAFKYQIISLGIEFIDK